MLKLRIFKAWESFTFSAIGPFYRNLGKSMVKTGLGIQGSYTSDDRLVPSLRRRPYQNAYPNIQNTDFIAPNAVVIGDVTIGANSSVWYGATLRGDSKNIKIGKNSVVQDLVSAVPRPGSNGIEIGNNVTIGPNTLIQSSRIENNAYIGMGSTVQNGAKIESYGVVAAGAVIVEDTVVPSYQIWAGNPARYLRDLTNEEKEVLDEHHSELQELARVHAEETEKSFREVLNDRDDQAQEDHYEPEELALLKMKELGFPMEFEDEDYIEQRVHHKQYEPKESDLWKKNYDPYEQDLFNFPDSFNIRRENYEQYEQAKRFFEQNPDAPVQIDDRTARVPPKDDSPWNKRI